MCIRVDYSILIALIASQWRVDAETRAAATRLALVSGASAAATARHTVPPRLTASDRMNSLMNLFRPIAELASQRVEWTTLATTALQLLLDQLRGQQTAAPLPPVHFTTENAAGAAAQTSDEAAGGAVPPHLGISNPAVKARKGKSGKRAIRADIRPWGWARARWRARPW